MHKKRKVIISIVEGILILCFVAVLLVVSGISIAENIGKQKKGDERLQTYSEQVALHFETELTAHDFPLKKDLEGIYFTAADGDVFLFSEFFAPYETGYGGPMKLLIRLDRQNVLQDIIILEHNETPAWIEKTADWVDSLRGNPLAEAASLRNWDGVSGATFTSTGILNILRKTAAGYLNILNNTASGGIDEKKMIPSLSLSFILLLLMLVMALLIRKKPVKIVRLIFMVAVIIIFKFWLNLQFSTYHILTLAKGSVYITGLNASLFFFVILPVAILVSGNIYCGYLCPFGLLQEVINEIFYFVNIRIKPAVDSPARLLKYVLLTLVVLSVLIPGLGILAEWDPLLISAASASVSAMIFAAILLILSIFFNRFWCKYLCPTGAFLSILNRVSFFLYKKRWKKIQFLKQVYQIPRPSRCDQGIHGFKSNRCICCDRCRYPEENGIVPESRSIKKQKKNKQSAWQL